MLTKAISLYLLLLCYQCCF